MRTVLEGALSYLTFLFCITVHEFSHAVAAYRFGDDTPKKAGRLSLNPVPHMDLFGTVLLPLLGVLASGAVIGYASTPVNPSAMRPKRLAPAAVVIAGPVSNAALFVLAGVAARFWGDAAGALAEGSGSTMLLSLVEGARQAAIRVSLLSGVLAVFNLIPAGPLDGAQFLRYAFPESPAASALSSGVAWMAAFAVFVFVLAAPTYQVVASLVARLAGV